jgi:type 2 lantibiotic biosynthesis protein LanM
MEPYKPAEIAKQKALVKELIELNQIPSVWETEVPFGTFLAIWADFAMEKLRRKSTSLLNLITPNVEAQLKNYLVKLFSLYCAPTLAETLHIARMEGKLLGETPSDRYLYYIQHILPKPSFLKELFAEYPLFGKTIAVQILLFVEQFHEFLERLSQLEKGRVSDLTLGLSDLHNGNRLVYKMEFEDGTSLVYKPKPLGLDKAYNELLEQLNELGLNPPLKTHQILNKGDYGWAEFIPTFECKNKGEVERYFERFGMLIALMYLMEGTDWHYENMIASGENPVLIDLESLFHPVPKNMEMNPSPLRDSVFRTAFLPSGEMGGQNRIDISPLSAQEEQEMLRAVAVWDKVNTDEMQFVFEKKKIKLTIPRPRFEQKLTSSKDYIEDLLRGFKKMYQLFSLHKEKILISLNPLFCYPVRCIYRGTQYYSFFLHRLAVPELMSSVEKTEETFNILLRFSQMRGYEGLPSIVEQEKIALHHLDIPFFMSSPSDCHIYLGDSVLAKECFERPAKEKVIERINTLNEEDLARQLFYIEHSLDFLKSKEPPALTPYSSRMKPLKNIRKIAEEIGSKILDSGGSSWINLEYEPKLDKHLFKTLSPNLYSGEAGVALFLIALGKAKFVKRGEEILERLKAPFYKDAEVAIHSLDLLGMNGLGGFIYAFVFAGKISEALHISSLITKDLIYKESHLNLMMGVAGLILPLLSLYEKCEEPFLLNLAEIAGTHLDDEWKNQKAGLFTGNAGVAYSLFKLSALTKSADLKRTFQNKALEAVHFERSQIDQWGRQAAGIGLARLLGSKYYTDANIEKDIEWAAQKTVQSFVGPQDALHLGNFGRIAFLRALDPKSALAASFTAELLEQFKQSGAFNLFPNMGANLQTPSLLHGLAGIGYSLLKMTKKGRSLPEILLAQ